MVDGMSGVQIGPGATLFARMPRGTRSWAVADLSQEQIKRRPVLGGLLNECERAAYNPRSQPAVQFWHPIR
jgi:hypothetical protein